MSPAQLAIDQEVGLFYLLEYLVLNLGARNSLLLSFLFKPRDMSVGELGI